MLRTRVRVATAVSRCGQSSAGVHGRYVRKLRDVAVGGLGVVIELSIRRFRCENSACPAVTFAEQITGPTTPHSRRTLRGVLTQIGLALAGRAGARLTLADRHCRGHGCVVAAGQGLARAGGRRGGGSASATSLSVRAPTVVQPASSTSCRHRSATRADRLGQDRESAEAPHTAPSETLATSRSSSTATSGAADTWRWSGSGRTHGRARTFPAVRRRDLQAR
ncbi:transposase family protein [Streptomyces achmelvichensis]|uniref:transposase family protein n=1 Tax=Streptomyces achmelvichensis TaxID=3134111 RepID=UPI003C12C2AD